jgi:hypothetical protein
MPKAKLSKKREPIKHKFVVAWCKYLDSKDYWIQDQLAKAEQDNAPLNAIYKSPDGTWKTVEDIHDPALRATMYEYVEYVK